MGSEIPADFFSGLEDTEPTRNVSGHVKPSVALRWYDGIIDDILANPGTTIKDTATRLGRHPGTISAICNSDLFKARWEQRRAQFSMALDLHLSQKLAQVAEKALDHTITTLDKKQDSIPLPILKDLALGSLDRLGYSPAKEPSAALNVNINNVGAASAEALARAREKMKTIDQGRTADREAQPSVAGQGVGPEGED
jgi:hypothetical protein